MSDRMTIRYTGIIQGQPRKEQRGAGFVVIDNLVKEVQEELHTCRLLEITRLEDVVQTSFPVQERRGESKISWDQPRVKMGEAWEEPGNLITRYIESLNVTAPDRSENLFIDTAHGVTPRYLPQGRPASAEGRDRGEYDEIVTERNQLKEANAKLIRRLSDAVRNQDMLRTALTASENGQLRMTESYVGIVRHVGRDDVVVLFEVDDDLVEHTYTRDQFVDSRLPEKGDRLAVYVHVAQLPPEELSEGTDEAMEGIDELRRRRRNILRGEEEF